MAQSLAPARIRNLRQQRRQTSRSECNHEKSPYSKAKGTPLGPDNHSTTRIGHRFNKCAALGLLDDEEQYIVDGDGYGNDGISHNAADHARDALTKIGLPALPALQTALKNESRTIRRRAAEAIGNIGATAQPAGDDLIRGLQDPHREVRAAAACSLGQIGDAQPASVAALKTAAGDRHLIVRQAATEALQKLQMAKP